MFTSTLSQIQELQNKNYDIQFLKSIIMELGNVNQIEIMVLMDIIHQLKLESTYKGSEEELLNELQDFLQSQLQTDRAASVNTNNLLEYKTRCNSNNTGLIIVNQYGQFILSDFLSRNILEINSMEDLEKKNFFSLISKASEGKLKQILKKNCLLQKGQGKDCFEVAIYSDRNRKKSLKYLNQIAQTQANLEKKIKKNTKKKIKIQSQQGVQELAKEQFLIAKYLKSIKVTIVKATLLIHEEFINSFSDLDDIVLSNLNTLSLTTANQLAICEVKELDDHIKLTVKELLEDPQISKHEIKWNKRVRKFKCEVSDDEMENEL